MSYFGHPWGRCCGLVLSVSASRDEESFGPSAEAFDTGDAPHGASRERTTEKPGGTPLLESVTLGPGLKGA